MVSSSDLMKRRTIQILILALWLVTTGWLVRYEAFPEFFARSSGGYKSLLRDSPLILDSWMKITFQGSSIGYSHTQLDTDEQDVNEQFVMHNQTQLDMNVLGERQRISVITRAALDAVYRLQSFSFSVSARQYVVQIEGRRTQGDLFSVRIRTGASVQSVDLVIPNDVMLYSPMTEMALSRLRPGQEQRIRTLDPSSLSVVDVLVKALRTETVRMGTNEVETLVLNMDYQGMNILSWMDRDGQMVRQETPFGWTMEKCSAAEAMAVDARKGATIDILAALAVPCRGEIPDPKKCTQLRLRLSGAPLGQFELNSDRQQVVSDAETNTDVVLLGAGAFSSDPPPPLDPAQRQEYLRATPFVQCDDPDMVKQARLIVGTSPDPAAAARAIGRWVYRNVEKSATVSLPSALDVLKVREGDCNEHTYLFVALARAAGLPAKIRVGLLYLNGAFYYHAWPAVYAGGWRELDPTLGQDAVDATHLALLEGELPDQLKLMSVVGRLQIEVLEAHHE